MPVHETSKGPLCHYDVLNLQGVPIRFANVGDGVVHRWKCDSGRNGATVSEDASDSHGFLVHSCVVRNEGGEEYKLVDERGFELPPFPVNRLFQLRCR